MPTDWKNFNPDHYDKYGLLKLDSAFYLVLALLMRPVLVWVASLTQRGQDNLFIKTIYPEQMSFYWALIPAGFAVFVVLPWAMRRETAHRFWAWLWQFGRVFLWLALLSDIALVVWHSSLTHFRFSWPTAVILCLQCWTVLYFLKSKNLGVYFTQWPKAEDKMED